MTAAHVIAGDAEAIEAATTLRDRFAAGAARRDAERILPHAELDALSSSGLLGITVPAAYGGADVRTRTLGAVVRLLSAGDGSIGQIPQNHYFFVDSLRESATPRQRELFFGEVLAGRRLGNALVNKRNPDGTRTKTELIPDPAGGFRITGEKRYSTGALFADWIPVSVVDGTDRLHTAYVPRNAPGLRVIDDWDGFGQRTTASGTVVLRDVHVPADQVVAHHQAYERPSTFRAFSLLIHAAIDVGIGEAALTDAVRYLRGYSRARPGAEPSSVTQDPVVIQRFGELSIQVRAARAMLEQAGDAVDEARAAIADPATTPEEAQRWAAEAAVAMSAARAQADASSVAVASEWFELAGAGATSRAANLDRHWRNARTHTVHDPRRLKVHDVGNYDLNGVAPRAGFERPTTDDTEKPETTA